MLQQLLLQGTTSLNEETTINRLMRHLAGLVVWVSTLEPSRNLLRRPQRLEPTRHDAGQTPILNQLTRLGALRPVPRRLIRLARPIPLLATVALDFSADGGRRSPEQGRHRSNRLTGGYRARYFFAFGQCQRQSRAVSLRGAYPTCPHQNALHRRVVSIKQLGNLLERIALLPALPHQRLLTFRVVDPRPISPFAHTPTAYADFSVLH